MVQDTRACSQLGRRMENATGGAAGRGGKPVPPARVNGQPECSPRQRRHRYLWVGATLNLEKDLLVTTQNNKSSSLHC